MTSPTTRFRGSEVKQNLNQRIRAYLENQSEPVLPLAVAEALQAPPAHVRNRLVNMKKVGMVLHTPGLGYSKGGRKPLTAKEASALGGQATKAKAVPKPVKRPKPIVMVPRKLGITEVSAVKEPMPCTETWLAQNPDKLIRIEPGRWSTDLRFDYR